MDNLPRISYRRSPENSYMIIEGDTFDGGFEERMLRENDVKALLKFYTVEFDRQLQIWYAITGKRSLRDLVTQEGLSLENMNLILKSLYAAWISIKKYLISKDNLYMTVDTVYFEKERDSYGAYLCYCPFTHPDVNEQIREILAYFVSMVDHEKQEITRLCYEMYEASVNDISFEELIELVDKYHNKSETVVIGGCVYDMGGKDPEASREKEYQQDTGLLFGNNSEERTMPVRDEDSDRMLFWDDIQKDEDTLVGYRNVDAEEKKDILSAALDFFKKFFASVFPEKKKEKPVNTLDENMIFFEPDTVIQEATVTLREDDREFTGKLVYEGNGDERDYLIDKNVFSIGSRAADNDANLNSKVVSRHHARIILEDNVYYLEDLNSTNGTFVNGKLVEYREKRRLNRMDRINFADVRYRII